MPGQDGTGPIGQGAGTGRGLGPCGRGASYRCPRRFFFRAPVSLTSDEQKKILEAELEEISLEKQEIEKRLKELK